MVRITNSQDISIHARDEILVSYLKGENYDLLRIGAGVGIKKIANSDNISHLRRMPLTQREGSE